jgi:VWFA-related protein
MAMTKRTLRWTLTILPFLVLGAGAAIPSAQSTNPTQNPTQAKTPPTSSTPGQTVFRATTNYVYNDFKVVDSKGQFVPGLSINDFKVFEDGVEQKPQFFQAVVGGRNFSTPVSLASHTASTNGLILPAAPPPVDSSGRIVVVFIDDMHLQTADTPIAKRVLQIMRDTLLHDGDRITIVGTGYSGIDNYPLMYYYAHNHARLDEAINKVYGSAMSPEEIVNASQTETGPAGLRYNMDTAFRTAYGVLDQLEKITNQRKAFIYLSTGYDLDPFKDSRLQAQQNGYDHLNKPGASSTDSGVNTSTQGNPQLQQSDIYGNPFSTQIGEFSETDLMREMAELIRAAKRADTAFYTVDPRGLVSSLPPGMTSLTLQEWSDYVQMSTGTLRALAEQTGGIAGVNTNDFKGFFQRVDADFSDYYELGYTSTDIDPMRKTRKIEIKVQRPNVTVLQRRDSYSLHADGEAIDKPKPAKPGIKRGGGGGGRGQRLP